jgi:hypothetical protein
MIDLKLHLHIKTFGEKLTPQEVITEINDKLWEIEEFRDVLICDFEFDDCSFSENMSKKIHGGKSIFSSDDIKPTSKDYEAARKRMSDLAILTQDFSEEF